MLNKDSCLSSWDCAFEDSTRVRHALHSHARTSSPLTAATPAPPFQLQVLDLTNVVCTHKQLLCLCLNSLSIVEVFRQLFAALHTQTVRCFCTAQGGGQHCLNHSQWLSVLKSVWIFICVKPHGLGWTFCLFEHSGFFSSLFMGKLKQYCSVLILPPLLWGTPRWIQTPPRCPDPDDKPIATQNLLKWWDCPDSIPVISLSHFLWLRKGACSISFMPWRGPNERMNRIYIKQAIFLCDGAHRLGWQVVWRGKAEKKDGFRHRMKDRRDHLRWWKWVYQLQRPNCNHKFL